MSRMYVEIFDQARAAESYELEQIAGVGYRKALEFLVKDYLIGQGQDRAVVERTFLGDCIKKIPDDRVKQIAERAAWLGNDETHYVRKFADHDVNSLKLAIRLTVSWIELELNSKQFIDSISKP